MKNLTFYEAIKYLDKGGEIRCKNWYEGAYWKKSQFSDGIIDNTGTLAYIKVKYLLADNWEIVEE